MGNNFFTTTKTELSEDSMSIYAIKPTFQKLLSPVAQFCIQKKISPDALNVAGMGFSLAAGVAILVSISSPLAQIAVPFALFARIACNALDGMVARAIGVSSRKGTYFNELFDRLSDAILFSCIAISGVASVPASALALAITLLVSFTGTLTLAAGGPRIYNGIMGKPDRMFVVGTVAVLALLGVPQIWELGLWTIVVGGLITMAMRISKSIEELSDESL